MVAIILVDKPKKAIELKITGTSNFTSFAPQATKVKVVGTFHLPSNWNPGKTLIANGTAERSSYFCRLCQK